LAICATDFLRRVIVNPKPNPLRLLGGRVWQEKALRPPIPRAHTGHPAAPRKHRAIPSDGSTTPPDHWAIKSNHRTILSDHPTAPRNHWAILPDHRAVPPNHRAKLSEPPALAPKPVDK